MSKGEALFKRWLDMDELTDEEISELQKEIAEFLQSDEPEEDKRMLVEYMKSYAILSNAVYERCLKDKNPPLHIFPQRKYALKLKEIEALRQKEQYNDESK